MPQNGKVNAQKCYHYFIQCHLGHEAELLMNADFYAIIIYIKC